jgi:hypothetical protein
MGRVKMHTLLGEKGSRKTLLQRLMREWADESKTDVEGTAVEGCELN